jgi:hypothetical protein
MKRVMLAALVLSVPLLGGFECNVDVTPTYWQAGDVCDYYWDSDDQVCDTSTTLLRCNEYNVVEAWDCSAVCDGGYCGADTSGWGWDVCLCPDFQWAPGYPCDFLNQYDQATCDSTGDILTYCAETDVIGSISCSTQCLDTYGASATGSCGIQAETGYNGCVCEFTGCDFEAYCYDALWQVSCDGVNDVWTDCNATCVADGSSKGVCDIGSGNCICG